MLLKSVIEFHCSFDFSVQRDCSEFHFIRISLIILTACSLGHDPQNFNISYFRRVRQKFWKDILLKVKAELKHNVLLNSHWDRKLLKDITEKEVVNRVLILVSRHGVDQLLSVVPKLTSDTGENTATAVYRSILD